jgi:HK97 family phage major capsid protein
MAITSEAQRELIEAQSEAEKLSLLKTLTPQQEVRFSFLLSKIKSLKQGFALEEKTDADLRAAASNMGRIGETKKQRHKRESREDMAEFRFALSQPNGIKDKTYALRTYSGMNTTTGSQGGLLVPAVFLDELFVALAQTSPLMSKDNVRLLITPDAKSMTVPGLDLTTITSAIIAQNASIAPSNANPTASKFTLGGYSYKTDSIAASIELQQDSFESLTSLLSEAFVQAIARGAGADLISGNGTTAPQGLITGAADSGVTSVSTASFTFNEIESIYFSLNRVHRNNPKCAWVMSDAVYQQIRLLKDSNMRPLLNVAKDDEVLMGKRILIDPNMPSAAGSKALCLSNLSQFVVRIAAGSVEVKKSDQAPGYVELGQSLFTAYARIDSRLITPAASTKPAVYATLHA